MWKTDEIYDECIQNVLMYIGRFKMDDKFSTLELV